MFPSISKATPLTIRTTSFTANRTMNIVPVTPFAITVNGLTPANPNNILANAGDIVTATITTPDDWLWHAFYEYEIDGVPSIFGVVNKSNYTIKVKPDDAIKRWYMYNATEYTATYKTVTDVNYNISFSGKYDNIPNNYHVLLNPIDRGVYFYDTNGIQVSRVLLPADPIDYVKIPELQSLVVLVRGGESYQIFLNNAIAGIAPFFARLNYSEFTDNNFVFQLPGEDLITYLRRARAKEAIPPATCVTYDGMFLFAGGNGSVWMVDPYDEFNLVNNYDIDEFVLNIAPLPNNTGIILVTQSHKIYKMDYGGNFTELFQGVALWQPALFNGKVYIPEGNIGLLKVYNPGTNSFESDIMLDDFSPSHLTVDSNKMYVAGHDTERVLVFDSSLNISEKLFDDKVTLVSAVNNTIIASHWMKSFKVLDLEDLRRIVAVRFPKRTGPVSHVGTSTATVKTLGNDEVFARTPSGTWLWVNGQRSYTEDVRGALLLDNDIISINRAVKVPGLQRTCCIIGDVIYDYDIEAITQTYFPRNIDFPVEPPGELGIHTRTITLPNFFTPCLISIEYGTLRVNGIYYYGDFLVTAGDTIDIEINTRNNSILPVFTVGARQFVVPVSTNAVIAPEIYSDIGLATNTSLVKEIEFGEFTSLFDYIIPGYYDVVIKKNTIDITGNYFQQFGKGDKLVVEYSSSPKLYDTQDVYILGPIIYKFTAVNSPGDPIDFLDYGNLTFPYTRQFDLVEIGYTLNWEFDQAGELISVTQEDPVYFLSNVYGYAKDFEIPEMQYYTANISISGIPFVNNNDIGNANITISGGDSYFVVDGQITSNINILVFNGNNLALARNVVSYFDVPVSIIQHLPTGDDDGWADIVVGRWGIINQEIKEFDNLEIFNTSAATPTYTIEVDLDRTSKTVEDYNVDLLKPTQRTINSFNQALIPFVESLSDNKFTILIDDKTLLISRYFDEELNRPTILNADQNNLEFNSINSITKTSSKQELDQIKIVFDKKTNVFRDVIKLKNVNSSTILFDKKPYLTNTSYSNEWDYRNFSVSRANTIKLFDSGEQVLDGSRVEVKIQPSMEEIKIGTQRLTYNLRLGLSYLNERDIPKFFVSYRLPMDQNIANKPLVQIGSTAEHEEKTFFSIDETVYLPERNQNKDLTIAEDVVKSQHIESNSIEVEKVSATLTKSAYSLAKGTTPDFNSTEIFKSEISDADIIGMPYSVKITTYSALTQIETYMSWDISWDTMKYFESRVDQSSGENYKTVDLFVDQSSGENYKTVDTGINPSPPNILEIHKFKINPSTPNKFINYYYDWTKGVADLEKLYERINRPIPFDTVQLFDIGTVKTPSRLNNNFRYYDVDMIAKITHVSDVDVDRIFDKFTWASTNAGQQFVYSTGNFMESLMVPRIIEQGELIFIEPEKEKFILNDPILVSSVYKKGQLEITLRKNQEYRIREFERESGIKMFYTAFLKDYYFVKDQYEAENTVRGTTVKAKYITDNLGSFVHKLNYMRASPIGEMYLKPNWLPYDYGRDAIVVYRLEHLKQNIEAERKMSFVRDRPALYFTAITIPELEQRYVWDHDISVEYGAFATEEDAITAAEKYSSFRPYLIFDTNLWSYRVLFDTGLVCPLPSGRYPVAWLIRGG